MMIGEGHGPVAHPLDPPLVVIIILFAREIVYRLQYHEAKHGMTTRQ